MDTNELQYLSVTKGNAYIPFIDIDGFRGYNESSWYLQEDKEFYYKKKRVDTCIENINLRESAERLRDTITGNYFDIYKEFERNRIITTFNFLNSIYDESLDYNAWCKRRKEYAFDYYKKGDSIFELEMNVKDYQIWFRYEYGRRHIYIWKYIGDSSRRETMTIYVDAINENYGRFFEDMINENDYRFVKFFEDYKYILKY